MPIKNALTVFKKSRITKKLIKEISFSVFLQKKETTTMRLSSTKLQAAMTKRGWSNEELARQLKGNGWNMGGAHIVQKWCKGKLQPSADRIELISAVVGSPVAEDPPRRRKFGDTIRSSQEIAA